MNDDHARAIQAILQSFNDLSIDNQEQDRHGLTVKVTRAHLSYEDRIIHILGMNKSNLMIMDSGADTTVVGQGWSVESYTGEKVNLVGFDNIHA